ncbi:GNAT family N-acetyltransferase [Georgenia yuyongxinii]|uniref:GNAT family N-acetyltransferase n=1 Tax=Georgenia yuyongxinii TaxID=2589797 RepID=A0A552WWR4_9MICO|nr:GNAT family N-acetyltransferase [Georgenia yuyongxinii]TRW47146.1 GNAT family N-acetyltransferase [Georgenia yuyongxinii]
MGEDGVGEDYPWHWAADVVLRDGATMHIRPIRPDDADALQRMHLAQSPESIYFRFFAPVPRLGEKDLYRFTHVDHHDRVALVMVDGAEIRAVGRFDVVAPGDAEVAFNVVDTERGRGLGSVLLEHLAAAARELGVTRFVADVLPANARMVRVFGDAGYEVAQRLEDGVLSISFSIEETERSWQVMAERERHAEALSMGGLLQAASVVVLGLGPEGEEGHVLAGRVAQALAAGAFTGPVHVVGMAAGDPTAVPGPPRQRTQVHRAIGEVPGPVDLAVVAGPPRDVVGSVPALRDLGVRAMVVLSHGFGESGPAGMARQRELLRRTRAAGIRVVGPASFGVVGHGPAGRYNATLWLESDDVTGSDDAPAAGTSGPAATERGDAPAAGTSGPAATERGDAPAAGTSGDTRAAGSPGEAPDGLGLFAQSLAAGLAVRSAAARRNLPVATFVSAGNRMDVSGNDTMQFWSQHPATAVGVLVLESMGNPRKFSRIARRLSASKPLVAVISGQTGQATPPGHAVRTSREPQRVLTEMLRQAGVVRSRSVREMLDVAALMLTQPLPAGPRTAVVSSSTALAGLVSDVLRAEGLEVAGEPVTLPPLAGAAQYEDALARLTARDDFDAVIVAHAAPLATTDREVAAVIARAAARDRRTWVASVYGLHGLDDALTAEGRRVPATGTVEDAVTALAGVVQHARWRTGATDPLVAPPGIDPAGARRVLADLLSAIPQHERRTLDRTATQALLACYGIEILAAEPVRDVDEAVAAAEATGWPVALKVSDAVLRHRMDLGGVRLDVADAEALRESMNQMRTRSERVLGHPVTFEVQAMAPPGVACVVRGSEDDLYGPVVAFGLGGDATELLGDVSYRIPPLTGRDVSEMVRSVRAAPRLLGHRGLPAVDVDALEDVVARVSMLTDDLPEVAEVVLNPVIVGEEGVQIASAVVTVAHPLRQDAGRRALPEPPAEPTGDAGDGGGAEVG